MGTFGNVDSTSERDNQIVEIQDGTGNGYQVGVTSTNRLKVDSEVSLSPAPKDNVIHKAGWLLNGSSSAMNVDGSSSNVSFTFTPSSGEAWYLTDLFFLIFDPSSMNVNEFGSANALTNGIDLLIKSSGTEYLYSNLKNNTDINLAFNTTTTIDSGASTGFYNDGEWYSGSKRFDVPIRLANSTGDYINFKVKDNLTSIEYLKAGFHAWRII